MVALWMDAVVWIVAGKKTHKALDVSRTDGEQFLPCERGNVTSAAKLHLEATDELHKPAQTRMTTLLVGKNPAIVVIMVVGLKKELSKTNFL